jgi:hypothetical protein
VFGWVVDFCVGGGEIKSGIYTWREQGMELGIVINWFMLLLLMMVDEME